MQSFWNTLIRALENGQSACLVSLLSSSGSTPRGAGAMMAVLPDGSAAGTIGGGNVEYQSQLLAAEVLRTGQDALRQYRFVQGGERSLGMVCGGDVSVQLQYISAEDAAALAVFHALAEACARGQNAWLVRRLEGGRVVSMTGGGAQALSSLPRELLSARPVLTDGENGWFSVPVSQGGLVHIFGAGHVSRALAAALHPLDFHCAVYDDRAEFADPSFFPTAERVSLCSFEKLDADIAPEDYVVVMTRGHQADYEVLTQTLRSGARYLGCIGSRSKLALCRERLLAAGFTAEEYAAVHAPIGLAIGAQTPEEIAVAVAAELIAVRAEVQPPRSA